MDKSASSASWLRGQAALVLASFLPFVFVILYTVHVKGMDFATGDRDGYQYFFSWAWNWFSLESAVTSYHPAILVMQVTAAILAVQSYFGVSEIDAILGLSRVSLAVYALFSLGVAVFTARLAKLAGLHAGHILVLSCFCAFSALVQLSSTYMVSYYFVANLAVPLGIAYRWFVLEAGRRPSGTMVALWLAAAGLYLLFSVVHATMVAMFVVAAAVSLAPERRAAATEVRAGWRDFLPVLFAILVPLWFWMVNIVCVRVFGESIFSASMPKYLRSSFYALFFALGWALALASLAVRSPGLVRFSRHIAVPALVGWLITINLAGPIYLARLPHMFSAVLAGPGAVPRDAVPVGVASLHALLMVLLAASSVAVAFAKGWPRWRRLGFVAGILGTVVVDLGLSHSLDLGGSRWHYMLLTPAVAMLCVGFEVLRGAPRWLTVAGATAVVGVAVAEYLVAPRSYAPSAELLAVDEAVARATGNGAIPLACVRDAPGRRCAVASFYNMWQSPSGRAVTHTERLDCGMLRYAHGPGEGQASLLDAEVRERLLGGADEVVVAAISPLDLRAHGYRVLEEIRLPEVYLAKVAGGGRTPGDGGRCVSPIGWSNVSAIIAASWGQLRRPL